MKTFLLSILLPVCVLSSVAQVGRLDSAFGTNGVLILPPDPAITPAILKIIPAPDNGFFVVYSSTDANMVIVRKILHSGQHDGSFGNAGYSDPIPMKFSDAAVQRDGKLVLAGTTVADFFPEIHDDLLVARLSTSGKLDSSFNEDGIITTTYTALSYEFTTSIITSEDMIIVGGYSVSLAGGFAVYHYDAFDLRGETIARVHLGELITDLQNYVPSDYQYSFAFQGDKVLVSSIRPDFDAGRYVSEFARYNRDGGPDRDFGEEGVMELDPTFFNGPLLVSSKDDKIIVASNTIDASNDHYAIAVGRFTRDGSPDSSFNLNGRQVVDFGTLAPVMPAAIIHHGNMLLIGARIQDATTQKLSFGLIRLNADGELDGTFDSDGKQVTTLDQHHLFLDEMLISRDRLLVTGRAASDLEIPSESFAVAAAYVLEDLTPGSFTCPGDTLVQTGTGTCTAVVNGIDPSVPGSGLSNTRYILSGATEGQGTGSASGFTFNKGITLVSYTKGDDTSATCSFKVVVEDREAPFISKVSANLYYSWPANWGVYLKYKTWDNCGPVKISITVASNEPAWFWGGGNASGDWQVLGDHHLQFRSKRWWQLLGRTYTFTITATDAAGNSSYKKVKLRFGIPPTSFSSKPGMETIDGSRLQVKVLPNPSTSHFTILLNSDGKERINLRVFTESGALLETRSGLSTTTLILGGTYSPGIYFAEIFQGDQRVVVKLVKQ